MTIYFQGSELEALMPNVATGLYTEDATNGGSHYDSTKSRGAVNGGESADAYYEARASQNLTVFWLHFWGHAYSIGAGTNRAVWQVLDGTGTPVVRFRSTNSTMSDTRLEYWNGAIWVTSPTVIDYDSREKSRYDLRIEKGTGGAADRIELYWNEMLADSIQGVGILSAFASCRAVRFYGPNAVVKSHKASQVIIADTPTLDYSLLTVVPTANGTDTDGVGTVADISEFVTNNATYISFDASGQKRGFKAPARTTSNKVKGFTVTARIRVGDETSPNQVKPFLKIGETYYYGDTIMLTLGYSNYQYTWNLNPATGIEWTNAEVNDAALEWGWEVV